MKRALFSVLMMIFISISSFAQVETALKQTIVLSMPDGGGSNGASVAWHPTHQRYYACMAGNVNFAMGIFDESGERLSDDTLTTGFDVRGFWWSPQLRTLCANGYDDFGWVAFKIDSKGNPRGVTSLQEGKIQPDEQSVGAFNPRTNELYFLDGQTVQIYSIRTGDMSADPIRLHIGSSNEEEALDNVDEEDEFMLNSDYNPTLIYTGKEFAILNYIENRIELYNPSTGYITRILHLPYDAPTERMLCFSYANGTWFVFEKSTRRWIGYR